MSTALTATLRRVGLTLQDHQAEAVQQAASTPDGAHLRLCLYHRTGAGKTITSLAALQAAGATRVLVLAPPITKPAWQQWAERFQMEVEVISHAKFRMKDYKVRRDQAMIVDEFHLLGGHNGKGWKKMDALARGLQAPLVICSATPNYNDAERVYCIQHVLDPRSAQGGYLQFLYDHCITRVNQYAATPEVDGFLHFDSAEDYLRSLPQVHYVEDEAIKQITIGDIPVDTDVDPLFDKFGLDQRRSRICASQMEARHARARHLILTDDGRVRPEIYDELIHLVGASATPVLMFCNTATIARAVATTMLEHGARVDIISGHTSPRHKEDRVQRFLEGSLDVLIGTSTLATGLDGVDKMCDTLLILQDTDDDSLRRQLMGRILPRGLDSDLTNKQVWRLEYLG